ncbi:MAG: hypothetical protein Q4G52_07610 [Clostridia bacterium]|nr:hypothetical protein [Clostridia bacterium]
MREKGWRLVLGTICCCAFLVLLLSGAERLVARQEDERAVSPPRAVAAFLTGSHADAPGGERGEARTASGERQARQTAGLSPARVCVSLLLRRDANGRVLSSRSYLREVYEVFALGDGFA